MSAFCLFGISSFAEICYPLYSATLQETLAVRRNDPGVVADQQDEARRIYWEQKSIDEEFVVSKLTSKLLKSRNQVADVQNPATTASDKQTRSLAYTQDFRNGLQWSLTHYSREEKPLTGTTTKKDTYESNILDVNGALWGKRLSIGELNRKEKELKVFGEQRNQQNLIRQDQLIVARAFLDYYYRSAELKEKSLALALTSQQLGYVESIKETGAYLEYENARLEQMDAAQSVLLAKQDVAKTVRALRKAIGETPEENPELEDLPYLQLDLNKLIKRYQNNQLVKDEADKQSSLLIDMARLELADSPEVVLGGYQGLSNSERSSGVSQTGSITGVYLKLDYKFGAGKPEKVQALRIEFQQGEEELADLKKEQAEQAVIDFQNFKESLNALQTQQEQLSVTRKLYETALQRSQVGRVSVLEIGTHRRRVVQAETFVIIAKKNQWEALLVLCEGAEFQLDQLLNGSKQSAP